MKAKYPLTLVEFKSWLESKNENHTVGLKNCSHGCPVFRCLKNKGEKVVGVGLLDTEFLLSNETYGALENPKWVQRFILGVDVEDLSECQAYVTAKDALEIVNNLYICTVCNQYNPEGTNCGKRDNCPW